MDIRQRFSHPFEPGLIAELESKGKIIDIEAGDTILDIGQTIKNVPVILEGSVKANHRIESLCLILPISCRTAA